MSCWASEGPLPPPASEVVEGGTPATPSATAGSRLTCRSRRKWAGRRAGTNPEQLFAVGYAACFQSALLGVARGHNLDASESQITSQVGSARLATAASGCWSHWTCTRRPDRRAGRGPDDQSSRALPVLGRHPRQYRGPAHRRRAATGAGRWRRRLAEPEVTGIIGHG